MQCCERPRSSPWLPCSRASQRTGWAWGKDLEWKTHQKVPALWPVAGRQHVFNHIQSISIASWFGKCNAKKRHKRQDPAPYMQKSSSESEVLSWKCTDQCCARCSWCLQELRAHTWMQQQGPFSNWASFAPRIQRMCADLEDDELLEATRCFK